MAASTETNLIWLVATRMTFRNENLIKDKWKQRVVIFSATWYIFWKVPLNEIKLGTIKTKT